MKRTTNFFCTAVWAMVGAIAILSPISEQLDERLWGFFFALRGTQSPPPEIVVLAIDGESLSAGETSLKSKLGTWPWKRAAYAEAIEQILNAGAKVVALDILLTSPSVHGVTDDARFQQTLERFGDRLVLAASYEDSQNSQAVISQLISPAQNFRLPNAAIGLVKYRANSLNEISHLNNILAIDSANDPNSNQGSDRPNFLSFAAATLKAAKIPISETKENRINYAGRDNTWLYVGQQKPFFYVLDPQNWQILAQQKFFQNKIVVIGATAPSLQDFQTSPLGRMSGVEINVNAIATLLRNSGIQTGITDNGLKVLLILGLIVATGLVFDRLRRPLLNF
jgi:adenylate cyclase